MDKLMKIASLVDEAARSATEIEQLSLSGQALDLDEAYAVQALSIGRREARGERVVGIKMGFTSEAKKKQMGLSDEIWGRLTDTMQVEDGGEISLANYVHPRAEPEIAFFLKETLAGEVTPEEAMQAVSGVAVAVEIIDSRYKAFKFNLGDVVADNTSSSSFVTGPVLDPATPIDDVPMVIEINGEPVESGSSSAILGRPVRALIAAARLVAEQGLALEPGWIVMAGAATAAHALSPGDRVEVKAQGLGRVGFGVAP